MIFEQWFSTQAGQIVSVYLVDMKKEYREVEEDDDEEGQDEDDSQRGEDPQQVLQDAQIVLHLTESRPLLQGMKQTNLWMETDSSVIRSPL